MGREIKSTKQSKIQVENMSTALFDAIKIDLDPKSSLLPVESAELQFKKSFGMCRI